VTGSRPIPVGLVSPLPPQLGGVTTIACWLIDHEQAMGCRYEAFDLKRAIDEAGGRIGARAVADQLRLLARFAPWARRSPSVVHFMIAPTASGLSRDLLYLGILSCFRRRTIAHLQVVKPTARWWRLAMGVVGRLSAEVVVVGSAAQAALEELGVRSRVVPNAIPFQPAELPDRAETNGSRPFRLLFAGTFGARKGCHELLQAIALLRRQGLDCRLDMVGREEYLGDEASLRAEVADLGLADAVHFLGRRSSEELASLYLSSDAFCLPSHVEGLPLALIEAMAHGLPAVATPVGSVEDVVIREQTGLLARVGDPVSLSEEIGRLARDPDLRRRLGRDGARHVATHMGSDVVAAAWREIYSSLA
jgi:glycosyltransferase involved in cell wall biosynthesis